MTFTTQQSLNPETDIHYPESDGKPMADNTKQFKLIVMIKENLEIWFAAMAHVFVAGDLLWYPIEGDNKTRIAPDAMVAFGAGKGDRGSYQQWKEDNIAPQVTFEVLSPSNFSPEMEEKRKFYETHGVEEYYSFDPDRLRLKGWLRADDRLLPIPEMNGWISPRLQIRFAQVNGELEIYRPDGRKFLTSVELDQLAQQQALLAEQQRLIAREEKHRAEREQRRAAQEQQRAEEQQQRAEEQQQRAEEQQQRAEEQQQRAEEQQQRAQEQQQRAEQEQLRADRAESEVRQMADQMRLVATNLLRSGMTAEQVKSMLGLPIEQITDIQRGL
jgi:Uma2 family endonuclease